MGMNALEEFRQSVGPRGPVAVVGGRTRWQLGGSVDPQARLVAAPQGIEALDPSEMTVSLGAGTLLAALDEALAEHGQEVALDGPPGATVGGALAVGHDSLRRRRIGSARDVLLQADYVDAQGALIKAGGPTVKNVTGYDLCRLLVGSLGTLGFFGQVILRTRPRPEATRWLSGAASPQRFLTEIYRPATILWDGQQTAVCLEGYQEDVEKQAMKLHSLGLETSGPLCPMVLPPHRQRLTEGPLKSGTIADVGSSVLYAPQPAEAPMIAPEVQRVVDRLRHQFDPEGRLNPGRNPQRMST